MDPVARNVDSREILFVALIRGTPAPLLDPLNFSQCVCDYDGIFMESHSERCIRTHRTLCTGDPRQICGGRDTVDVYRIKDALLRRRKMQDGGGGDGDSGEGGDEPAPQTTSEPTTDLTPEPTTDPTPEPTAHATPKPDPAYTDEGCYKDLKSNRLMTERSTREKMSAEVSSPAMEGWR